MANSYYCGEHDDVAKVQPATDPHAERKAIEEALAFFAWASDPKSHISVLIKAARKHLETLPKPEPRFRVVAALNNGCGRVHMGGYTRDEAVHRAGEAMHTGIYNSVSVEQVSP